MTDLKTEVELVQLNAQLAKEKHAHAATKKKLKQSEGLVQQQMAKLEGQKSKFRLPTGKTTKSKKGTFLRVCIPDTHGAHVDKKSIAAFLGDLENLSPREVVWLGDHLECGGFLASHFTMGYVMETGYTVSDDIEAANQLLDKVQELTPGADHHYIEGNHEHRIERFCVTTAQRSGADAAYLMKLHGTESVLSLEQRGIAFYRQGELHGGLTRRGTLRLGQCHFTHGSRTGKYAAKNMLDQFDGNVVFGHTHQVAHATKRSVKDGVVGAWSAGCLCRLQPYWMHTNLTNWSHAYVIQVVESSGDFLTITVPIINGKSYLLQLAEGLA